jgi:hypothetical protein
LIAFGPPIRTLAPTVRHLASYIDAPYALEPLGKSIGEAVEICVDIASSIALVWRASSVKRRSGSG